MKKKLLYYAIVPAVALGFMGAGVASAHNWFGYGGAVSPDEAAKRQAEMFQQKAGILGISVDEAKNAWAQGRTVRELAQEKGISEEQLRQKAQDLRKQRMAEHLKVLVDKGVITQSQADQRLQYMEKQQGSGRMGRGMRNGLGGGFGFGLAR